ncbi:P-loop containing nucleoside triphosphate hydrolase protein [Cantharellus anzutake]|uniref:P-loop containing nucleoside triphosphate hydrolase protein n=1 Tax=Cantharellus anzutake TaxID=1750568 RepID=UPI0019086FE5|nr:P-loop containing nucleoside triphosphate hydrolase protein [Cantharellus anzutake]KAF8339175.1 P-loop containing nucleoside triphosphate hydrolase protein [Cantharellus anzutake]
MLRNWNALAAIARIYTIPTQCSRKLSFQACHNVRNIALLAHIDSGKTTLTESILFASSFTSSPGTVDTGSTTTDFLPAERERGITIQSASIPVKWRNWTLNLIDTPGHVDFGMEVEAASRVVDGAVLLLDSVEGVEGQTLGVWGQLNRHEVPTRMVFLNKLDRPGASVRSSIKSILAHRLHPCPIVMCLPIASFDSSRYISGEPGVCGIVDLVKWEVWKWSSTSNTSDAKPSCHPLLREGTTEGSALFSEGHPLLKELMIAREAVIDSLCVRSPDLMNSFLSLDSHYPYLALPNNEIIKTLRQLTQSRDILPVLCGSALRHVGTDLLLDYIGELLASPLDTMRLETGDYQIVSNGMQQPVTPSLSEVELQALAWKVAWDSQRGWMTFVRIYSGTLTRQTILFNTSSLQRERPSKLLLMYASDPRPVEQLSFGSVGVILGLKHTRTGDTLVSTTWQNRRSKRQGNENGEHQTKLRNITPPTAVISASVLPHSQSDVKPVQQALEALIRTDPSVRVTDEKSRNDESGGLSAASSDGQTLIHGLGALHLEIVERRLKEEWGVRCSFGKRQVSYREALGMANGEEGDEVDEIFEREINGQPVNAAVKLHVRPLNAKEVDFIRGYNEWGGNVVVDHRGRLLSNPANAGQPDGSHIISSVLPTQSSAPLLTPVLQGIANALATSPHSYLPLSHVHIQILKIGSSSSAAPAQSPKAASSASSAPTLPPPAILMAAASHALRTAIRRCGPGDFLEPFIQVKVNVADEHLGKVIRDLIEGGGEVVDMAMGEQEAVAGYEEDGVYIPPAWVTPTSGSLNQASSSEHGGAQVMLKRSVHAFAPLSSMLDYSTRLRALSGGMGAFEMNVEGFRVVSHETRKQEILRELGRA